jgi:hypothetical protein
MILDAQCHPQGAGVTAAKHNAPSIMLTAVQSFPPVPPVAAPDTSGDNSGLVDSCLPARSTQTLAVRQKFEDIFQVSKSCHIGVNSDLENYSDNVSVAARLSDPGVIEFFRSIELQT